MFSQFLRIAPNLLHSGHFVRQLRLTAACLVKGTEVRMPSLSPTMTEGTIIKWHKKEGEKIEPGEVICEIQTDKAVVAYEIEEEAVLAKILVPEDVKDVKVGSLIALFVEEGEDWKDVEVPSETATPAASEITATESVPLPSASTTSASSESSGNIKRQAPSARNLMHHYGIDVNTLKSSGPHNTLLKEDVLNFIQKNNLQPGTKTQTTSSSGPRAAQVKSKYTDLELTNMRKIIAKRLTMSKTTIPHAFMTVECNMNEVSRIRQQMKSSGAKVSVNDFIIKAVGVSLSRCPRVNVRWNEKDEMIEAVNGVDISIAVATPTGLITPIIKDANILTVEDVAKKVKELSGKAREGKLQPHEFQGGSFSISNLGMFGIKEFSAVINPPQAAILAVGRGIPTFDEFGKVNELMRATLSYDARAVDEETAAEFMETLSQVLADPSLMERSHGIGKRLAALV